MLSLLAHIATLTQAERRKGQITEAMRKSLQEWYGVKADHVKYAEASEMLGKLLIY